VAIKKATPGRQSRSFDQFNARHLARQYCADAIAEVARIAMGRRTLDTHIVEFNSKADSLLRALKSRKLDGHSAAEQLQHLVSRVNCPPGDSDIIRASDILLNRGWGRPTNEGLDFEAYIGMDDEKAREHVQAALVARAIQGDVAAQQAYLRLPTKLEVGILGDEQLDAGLLDESELALFLSLVEKMRPSQIDKG